MSKKQGIIFFLSLITRLSAQAQSNYLAFDYSFSQFKLSQTGGASAGIFEKLNRCEGNYTGVSYHFRYSRKSSVSIGMGLSKVNYQKEWMGTFPESNQFGVALVKGQIAYWSFPVSYSWIGGVKRTRRSRFGKDRLHFGFTVTYTPSFEGKNSFSLDTYGGASHNTFLSSFHSNEQSFQHSLTVGFCDQLFLFDNYLRLDIEPYAGIGSSYFKEGGTSINNICYGLRFRIALNAKLPHISINKEVDKGNAEEKKKLLQQKQKEIREQLNINH